MVLGLFLGLISWIGSPQSKVQLFGLGLIQFHSVAISKCLIFFFFCLIILIFTKPSSFFLFFLIIFLLSCFLLSLYYFFVLGGGKYKSGAKICIYP